MKNRKGVLFLVTVCSIYVWSCKKELLTPVCDGSEPTYDTEIKSIIDASCMGSSCHRSGSTRGDFTSYSKLRPFLDNGKFKSEVLLDQTMPRNATLSQEQINTIQCWVDNGYPEN